MNFKINKLIVISPPLILKNLRSRYKRLAKINKIETTALVPSKRRAEGYGEAFYISTVPEKDGKFELKSVATTSEAYHRYWIRGFKKMLRQIQPDLIFCVHHEGILQLWQCIIWRKLFFRNVKLVYFSMTAFPRVPKMKRLTPKEFLKQIYFRLNWWLIRHGTDGCLCHYDRIENQMRLEGYKKPILQQTQYGVDPEQFKPDADNRQRVREHYGLKGCVIGICGRFVPEKGFRELMSAFEQLKGECSLLLVGDGELRPEIEAWIEKNHYQDRVKISGYVPHTEVQGHFQAMDIFVLGSKETPTYIDTFPLVVAQAMTMGLPVVGSISGAIPYQLGDKGLLFQEGDAEMLREHLQFLIDHPEKRVTMGRELHQRALENFCVDAMNEEFLEFLENRIL